ncbi:MAG: hypothetical protein GY809_33200 [Planctomycetes bacterium]|nr:hypothetical protein [Planctomycetota bacterium]
MNQQYGFISPLYHVRIPSGQMTKIPGANAMSGFTLSPDGKWMAYTDRRVDKPLELYCAQIRGGKVKQLTHVNKEVSDQVDIRPAEQTWVTGADGKKIHVFIVKPHDFDPDKKYPLINAILLQCASGLVPYLS